MGSALFGAPHYAGALKESSGGQMGTNKKRGGSVRRVRIQILSKKDAPIVSGVYRRQTKLARRKIWRVGTNRSCSLVITEDSYLRI